MADFAQNLQPTHGKGAGDDADLELLGIETRTLLDVQFEQAVVVCGDNDVAAPEADGVQRTRQGQAIAVGPGMGEGQRLVAGEDGRADHRRLEAAPSSLVQFTTAMGWRGVMS